MTIYVACCLLSLDAFKHFFTYTVTRKNVYTGRYSFDKLIFGIKLLNAELSGTFCLLPVLEGHVPIRQLLYGMVFP